MRLRHCPPISALTTPYASASLPHLPLGLQSLHCCAALKVWPDPTLTLPTCLQHCLPSLRLQCPPNMPPLLLTILMLAVTSQHASNAAYHPYTLIVPAQNASDAAYHPYTHSALPTCLQCRLPSLRLQ
ncbi:hypothetical protein O181_103502 [Austropuccinia psidii MF-1]|uniref:Uncharacterized protein n=1 Tax=Austropuccinia psidii MF-1 TaxID=1389203 RepID=A0A9Q3JJW7_9BASI|nr:hypothetical protein [Austropuccinia psidii MF-1]